MHAHSIKHFTHDKLEKMRVSGSQAPSPDRNADSRADDYGNASGKNSAEMAHGGAAKAHPGRPGRAHGGRAPKGKTVVNIMVGQPQQPPARPVPVPVPAPGGIPAAPPPRPPMAMAGGPMGGAMPPMGIAPGGVPPMGAGAPPILPRKRGGRVSHSDEPEDRELIHKMVKHGALTGEKHGGRVHKAGGGGIRSEGARDAENDEHLQEEWSEKNRTWANKPTPGAEGKKHGGRIKRAEGGRDAENDAKTSKMSDSEKDSLANERRGGRVPRAYGGPVPKAEEETPIRGQRAGAAGALGRIDKSRQLGMKIAMPRAQER